MKSRAVEKGDSDKTATRPTTSSFAEAPPVSLLNRKSLVQRACACGGGCPRCQSSHRDKTPIPSTLAISTPGDRYEQEADRVAEHVTRMREPTDQRTDATSPAGGIPGPAANGSHNAEGLAHGLGPGRPLDSPTRSFFEPRFGHDFSAVRVHADDHAARSARSLDAKAYTVGHDVVFAEGQYLPGTSNGQRLLAHELTHVVQQGTPGPLGLRTPRGRGEHSQGAEAVAVSHAPTLVQKQGDEVPTAEDEVSRILADRDENAILDLDIGELVELLAHSTPTQRAGMVVILNLDVLATGFAKEERTLQLIEYGEEDDQVLGQIEALGYTQTILDSVDEGRLHARLQGYVDRLTSTDEGDPALDSVLASGDWREVMAVDDFSMASNGQRVGLLRILLDMSWSNAPEESKMLDILASSGAGLGELMDQLKGLALKESLFDQIDTSKNVLRFADIVGSLGDEELNADLVVLDQSWWGALTTALGGGLILAWEDFIKDGFWAGMGKLVLSLFHPVLHPLDTFLGLWGQLVDLFEHADLGDFAWWERLLTFVRDTAGAVAAWIAAVAAALLVISGALVTAAGVTGFFGAVPATIVLVFASGVVAGWAAAVGVWAGWVTVVFLIAAALKAAADLIQASTANTSRQLAREEEDLAEDFSLGATALALLLFTKAIKRSGEAMRRTGVDEEAASREGLKKQDEEAHNANREAKDRFQQLEDEAAKGGVRTPQEEVRTPQDEVRTPQEEVRTPQEEVRTPQEDVRTGGETPSAPRQLPPMSEKLKEGIVSQAPPTRVVGEVREGEQIVRKTVATDTLVGRWRYGEMWGAESIRAQEAALNQLEAAGIDTARVRQSFSETGELILDYAGRSVEEQWSSMEPEARAAYDGFVKSAKKEIGLLHDLKKRNIAYQRHVVNGQVIHRFVIFDPAFDRYSLIVATVGGVGVAAIGSITIIKIGEAVLEAIQAPESEDK